MPRVWSSVHPSSTTLKSLKIRTASNPSQHNPTSTSNPQTTPTTILHQQQSSINNNPPSTTNNPPSRTILHQQQSSINMPLFYSKGFGGRRAGGTITADRHGVHRPIWRMRLCGLNCFR
ncbi:hypothetical protein BJ875DRAFT_140001 [Amylocarpus encephaloides]|uniref:Uncharacterized protein n=1 Tax=Amylocarpus encephaloides TaxID=45428 RepID=A0A9P8C2C6_9HELO|nr:hypothetical protein BJ875DRAFT_140001 [Amylocarpus encephaloides]